MAKVDFGASRKQAEASGELGGGDYFKIKEGANRFRLMTECLPYKGSYKGTANFKWLCYILDRRDQKLKTYFMPHTIYKQIEALQLDTDYAFAEVPMPYDLTVNAKGAGTKEVEYSVIPAKKETPLTADEEAELDQAKPIAEVKQALRDKQAKEAEQPPAPEITDNDVPFAWLLPFALPVAGALTAFSAAIF